MTSHAAYYISAVAPLALPRNPRRLHFRRRAFGATPEPPPIALPPTHGPVAPAAPPPVTFPPSRLLGVAPFVLRLGKQKGDQKAALFNALSGR